MASDWIDSFLLATQGIRSSDNFRLWTAITILSSTAERRIYCYTDAGMTHPNLFTVLCGPPGSGKTQAIAHARNLLIKVPDLQLAPDDTTKAAFFDRLQSAVRSYMNGYANLTIVSALAVVADELGVFIPRYDMEFLSSLSKLYDNPPHYDAPRRTSVSVKIDNPTVNIIAGVQPDFLSELIPEAAWGQGFMARIIFVYGGALDRKNRDIFARRASKLDLEAITAPLISLSECSGEMVWTEKARAEFNSWHNAGMLPVPTHGRLRHYNERRDIHTVKLSMISALSAGHFPEVMLSDFERATHWLLTAEETMPDIFRAMAMRSDKQIIEDLHHSLYSKYMSLLPRERKPVHVDEFTKFLFQRIPHEKIKGIIETAIDAGYFAKGGLPNEYIPRPLNEVNGIAI